MVELCGETNVVGTGWVSVAAGGVTELPGEADAVAVEGEGTFEFVALDFLGIWCADTVDLWDELGGVGFVHEGRTGVFIRQGRGARFILEERKVPQSTYGHCWRHHRGSRGEDGSGRLLRGNRNFRSLNSSHVFFQRVLSHRDASRSPRFAAFCRTIVAKPQFQTLLDEYLQLSAADLAGFACRGHGVRDRRRDRSFNFIYAFTYHTGALFCSPSLLAMLTPPIVHLKVGYVAPCCQTVEE